MFVFRIVVVLCNNNIKTKTMNFTVNRKQFLSALKISAQAVSSKNILPIMDCLKIDLTANSTMISITGGNEEMYITNTCQMVEPSDVEYSICINAKDLIAAIDSIDDEVVTISTDDSTEIVEIQYKRGKLSYPFFSADEYSVMPVVDSNSKVSIPDDVLAHLINKTIKFVGEGELKPTITGINFSVGEEGDGILVCYATNGNSIMCKVSVSDIDTTNCIDLKSFILPMRACQSIIKSISSNTSDKMVDISFSEKNITFKIGGISVFSRCIEGRFPNCNGIIPKNNNIIIEVGKSDFLSAIGRVGKSLSKDFSIVKMNLSLSGLSPEIELVAENIDAKASGVESMECNVCSDIAENMTIGINKDLANTVISNLSTTQARICFSSPQKAIIIKGYDGDEGITMLLMPFA